MAGGSPPAGLCCFNGRARYLILILSTIAISTLFANLILFNLTSILHTEIGDNEKPVFGLSSLNSYTIKSKDSKNRKSRSTNEFNAAKDAKWEEEGHPVLQTIATTLTTTTPRLTTIRSTKPKTVYITNSPTAGNIETTTIKSNNDEDDLKREYERAMKHLGAGDLKPQVTKEETKIKNDPNISKEGSVIKRTILYMAPGLGVLAGLFINNMIISILGARIVFAIILASSALTAFAMPFVATTGFFGLLAIRFIQGFLFSASFPLMGKVLVKWGTVKEQLGFIAVQLSFLAVGPFISWSLTMILYIIDVELKCIYVAHGSFLLLLALTWLIIYRDEPGDHPWVSGSENRQISVGKAKELDSNRSKSEFSRILLRSYSAWSIWFSFFGTFIAVAFFATYLPAFLASPDVFLIDFLGLYSALPFFFLPTVCVVFAVATRIGEASTKTVRIWNGIGFGLAAILVFLFPIVTHFKNENITLLFLIFPLAPLAISIVGGFGHSLTIVGRVYAEQIVSFSGHSFGVAFIIMPIITSFRIIENKNGEWWSVTTTVAIFLVGALIEFSFFGRGRCSSWAESSWDPLAASAKMNTLSLIEPSQDERGLIELQTIEP